MIIVKNKHVKTKQPLVLINPNEGFLYKDKLHIKLHEDIDVYPFSMGEVCFEVGKGLLTLPNHTDVVPVDIEMTYTIPTDE